MSEDATAETRTDTDDGKRRITQAWPTVVGRPGFTPGRYGAVGNLELVACAADDGLWVGWFNRDHVDTREGAAVGKWSGALRFGRGPRYVAASITQVHAGPDWLEVLALTTGGQMRRLVWSPELGFVDHGAVADGVVAASQLVELPDGGFVVVVVTAEGLRALTGRPGPDYPQIAFRELDVSRVTGARYPVGQHLTDVDAAWHDDHLDIVDVADGSARWHCPAQVLASTDLCDDVSSARLAVADGRIGVAVVSRSGEAQLIERHRDGEPSTRVGLGPAESITIGSVRSEENTTWHVVTGAEGSLSHHQVPAGSGKPPGSTSLGTPVEAVVWAAAGTTNVHREG